MKSSKLNLFDITMIVVGLVIGMGIFRTPVNVARQAGSADMFFLAWIVGGIIALCGALTYAEIGSRYPATGGYYKIFSHCYHPSIAFAINCIILVSNAASLAAVALVGSEYLANVLFKGDANIEIIKLVISSVAVIIFYSINLLGLTTGLSCCLLIGLYMQHELSYDNFQKNGERTARGKGPAHGRGSDQRFLGSHIHSLGVD